MKPFVPGEKDWDDVLGKSIPPPDDLEKGITPPQEEETVFVCRGILHGKQEWDLLNEKYIIVRDLSRTEVLSRIKDITVANDQTIGSSLGFSYKVPSLDDKYVEYDGFLKQICLKRNNERCCSFTDPNTCEMTLAITAALSIVQDALLDNIPVDLRYVFYRAASVFKKQRNSDDALYHVCCLIGCPRHCLNVNASTNGLFIGPITLKMHGLLGDYDIACEIKSMEGSMVPISPGQIAEILFTGQQGKAISFILVVEKRTIFHYLVNRQFHIKFNCIIITGGGSPDISTRFFLNRLSRQLSGVPVYAFVDADPEGIQIFCTYKFGSRNMAFDNYGLATHNLVWIGLCPEKVKDSIPLSRQPLTSKDIKLLKTLLKRNYVSADWFLRKAINDMITTESQYEIEAVNDMGAGTLYEWIVAAIERVPTEDGASSKKDEPGSSART